MFNKDGASASLRDRATGEEFARLDAGVGPHEAAVSPDGRIAVVDVHDRGSAKSSRNRNRVASAANRSKTGATAGVRRIRSFFRLGSGEVSTRRLVDSARDPRPFPGRGTD